jgi:putative acetyltransferase
MARGAISVDDPRAEDVRRLLQAHLEFTNLHTPPEDMHALDIDALVDPAVAFFSLRCDGELLGVGALREIDPSHAELKSMHTAASARGQGVGRAMVEHLVEHARRRGFVRVSLETGSTDVFAPARALYAGNGFAPCGSFGDYPDSPNSTFMTMLLGPTDPTD